MKNFIFIHLLLLIKILSAFSQTTTSTEVLTQTPKNIFDELAEIISFEENGLVNQDPPWPPIWFYPHSSAVSIHAITILLESNPRINNIPIEPNDYIGVFFTDLNGELKCGGGVVWKGDQNIIFPAYGDDFNNPEKTGFTFAEQMYFKIFKWQTHKDYYVDIYSFTETSLSTDKWYPLGISVMNNIQALEDFDFYIGMSANPICLGNQLTLSAQEFIGTTGNYTFSWSSNPPGFNHSVRFPPPITPTVKTTYYLTVSDGNLISQHERTVIINQNPQVSVSSGGTICTGQNFAVSGTAINHSSVIWTTNGDGSFSNPSAFQTNYIPGNADKANGQVTLSFTAFPLSPCTMTDSKSVNLIIQKLPTLEAGNNIVGCRSELTSLPMAATASNYSTVVWTTNGDGTFSNPNTLNPLYYPGTNDLTSPFLQLSVCIQAISPCVQLLCDNFLVSFINGPTCNAPNSRTRCADLPVSLSGTAANYSLIEWTTQGDGTFLNPNIFSAQYYGGPQDRLNGGNIVTLNALPNSPCTVTATKNVNIIWLPIPSLVTFGTNTEFLCPGQNFVQLNAQVNNYSSLLWTTSGNGTFSSTTVLNPKYYPGTQDYQNGSFQLNLTAGPVSSCTNTYTFSQTTIIATQPQATILTPNGTISCGEIEIQGAAASAASVLWQTAGDGTFSNPQILNPIYYPGTNDILFSGSIQLSLTAFPLCTQFNNSVVNVQLTFNTDAVVFAGNDASICETSGFFLSQATASNYSSLLWTTAGDGTFNNPNILKPTYFPGNNDKNSGSVVLTLTGASIPPCTTSDLDQVLVTIFPAPTVFAGNNSTVCENQSLAISGATAANFSQLQWTTSGDGTFSNSGSLNPSYYPGNGDKSAGSVVLTFSATGVSPCNFAASATRTLTIQKLPVVNAGSDVTVCGTTVLSGTGAHYSSILWTTSGDGTFSNQNSLVTAYFPGISDFANQMVVVELTASPLNFCTVSASDQKNILINVPKILQDNVINTEVFTTQNLELTFIVSNPQLGNFSWYKDGKLLNEFQTGTLIITDVLPKDAGVYQCVFTNGCGTISSAQALIEVLEPTTTLYSLTQGWQGISSWFQPHQNSIPDLFGTIENQVVIIQNETGLWWPQQAVNTIGPWSNNSGYLVKMTESVEIGISGIARYPLSGLEIKPGWSYLSVKSPCQVDVSELFSSHPEISVVKAIAGVQLYWPQYGINSLLNLEPGKAYQVYNSGTQSLMITFPGCR